MKHAGEHFSIPPAPAMPVVQQALAEIAGKPARDHQDYFADPGTVTSEWFSLVHTPAPIKSWQYPPLF